MQFWYLFHNVTCFSCWFAAKCNFVYFCRGTGRMSSSLLPPIHIFTNIELDKLSRNQSQEKRSIWISNQQWTSAMNAHSSCSCYCFCFCFCSSLSFLICSDLTTTREYCLYAHCGVKRPNWIINQLNILFIATAPEADRKSTATVKKGEGGRHVACFLLAKSTSLPLKCYPCDCVWQLNNITKNIIKLLHRHNSPLRNGWAGCSIL